MLSSTSSGLCTTPDSSIFRKRGRMWVMWDDEEVMDGDILVPEVWGNLWFMLCLTVATFHGTHMGRREGKGEWEHLQKRWCEPVNTACHLLLCFTNTFILTPYKTETLLFQPKLTEPFTVTSWKILTTVHHCPHFMDVETKQKRILWDHRADQW